MESLSRPLHRRKLSSANGFSFSAKQHPYDGVLTGSQPKFGAPGFPSGAPDYSEIFGVPRVSSIPLLDLSGLDDATVSDDCRSSSKLDYSNIFGGFSEEDIAVPYEELFSRAKRGKRPSAKSRTASEGSDQFSPSGRQKESSCEATNQSLDGQKHFNLSYHKISQRSRDGSNGMTQIAQLHAVPGFTHFIDESSHLPKAESCQRAPFVKSDVLRQRSFSREISKGCDRKEDLHVPKIQSSDGVHRNKSFSGEIFKEGHARNGDLHVPRMQSSDRVHRNRSFSGEIFKEGHARNGDLHVPKKQSSDGHRNSRFSGEIFIDGRYRNGDLHVPKKQSSDEVHHDRSFSGELFNGYDRKENLHVTKKQSSVGVVKVTSLSSWDAFNENFCSAHDEFDRRSSSTEGASTSRPMANVIKGQPYQSKISGPDSKFGASRSIHATDTSPPSSDEELDANSAAAISAATLKKAIEKAQESIRLAKELMERKNEGDPASQKRRSKGSLKSKDNRVECNTRSDRGNIIDLQRKIGIGLPPFAEVCRGIPASNANFASCFNLKEQQRVAGNVEASHRDAAGTWFPEVESSRKEKAQTLASQQVESNNHSQPFILLKEMNTSNKTVELGEAPDNAKSMGDINPALKIFGKAEAPEQYKGSSNSALMHDSEEYINSEMTKEYCFSKEKGNCSAELKKSENMKNNLESTFAEQWSFKNLQDSPAPVTEEKIEFQEMENDNLHNNRNTPPGNESLKHEDAACRKAPKKLEKVEIEENKSRLRRSSDEEETDFVHEDEEETDIVRNEAFLWVENDEKPQHGCEEEGTESRQEDFQGEQDTGISYGVHERELSENKTTHSHEGEECERRQEGSEREVLQNISVESCQYEPTEEIENRPDKFTQNRKTEASQEAEETDSGLEASDKSEDDQETSVAPGVADEQKSKKAINEPDHDGSTCSSEMQEACEYQLENDDLGKSELPVDFEGIQGISEAINEHAECEKDGVSEESSSSRETEIMETASDLQNASEEDTSEGMVQETYEASSEDAKEVSRGSTCMNSIYNLPSERVMFETESFCDVILENVSDNESHFVPEVLPSEEQENITFTDINLEQKCMDETGKEPEESSILDERNDSWVCGHVENEETIKGDSIVDQVETNKDIEAARRVKKSVENSEDLECSSLPGDRKDNEPLDNDVEVKTELHEEENNLSEKTVVEEETKESLQNEVEEKNNGRKTEADMRQREREKDRIAVERAIREARERAFAEARERAERAAMERATAEVRQRVMAEAREKHEKASASIKVSTGKASIEAKLKAERAAVERATAEARERALEKALSQKSIAELRSQVDKDVERFASTTRENGLKHSLSSSDLEKFDGSTSESAQRRKARLERHQRIMERAAKALEEKNQRDLLAQKEQTERNRLAEALDVDIKRWASGKEGNLRALLSTLQYILGADSGWQPISLTEIITTAAVKKAYRKATLYVHPDKLQQRGASIQQKYVCEKVFDLLKAAWNRFNSEER